MKASATRGKRRPKAPEKKPVKVDRGAAIVAELPPPPQEQSDDAATLEFLQAIDTFKRKTGKTFPSWTDILGIVRGLGYSKR